MAAKLYDLGGWWAIHGGCPIAWEMSPFWSITKLVNRIKHKPLLLPMIPGCGNKSYIYGPRSARLLDARAKPSG